MARFMKCYSIPHLRLVHERLNCSAIIVVECNQGLNELLTVVGFILTTLGFFQVHVDGTSILVLCHKHV